MKRVNVAASMAVIALVIAVGAGTLLGSWATAKTGKTIPILLAAPLSNAVSKVSFEDGFAPVVKRAVPAVVNVSSSKVIRTKGGSIPSSFFSDPFFRQFFGNSLPKDFQIPPSTEREQSLGSGVIINPDGYILTNNRAAASRSKSRSLTRSTRFRSAARLALPSPRPKLIKSPARRLSDAITC